MSGLESVLAEIRTRLGDEIGTVSFSLGLYDDTEIKTAWRCTIYVCKSADFTRWVFVEDEDPLACVSAALASLVAQQTGNVVPVEVDEVPF